MVTLQEAGQIYILFLLIPGDFFSFECEMEVNLMIIEDTRLTALKTEPFYLSRVLLFLICKLEKILSVGSRFSP